MRLCLRIILLSIFCYTAPSAVLAATYDLEDGGTIVGEPLKSTASDAGVKIRLGDGTYTNVSWGTFSQDALKELADEKRYTDFVEPFIIITAEDKARMTEVDIKEVERLSLPESSSVISSLFKSALGWILILSITAASAYAGYEIAIFRARNVWLLAALGAVPFVGFVSNIIWLSMPTYIEPEPELTEEEVSEQEALQPEFKVPLAGEIEAAEAAAAGHAPQAPQDEVFKRGKFTFNRRFFETRFAGFFGTIRRGEQKDMVLVFKAAKARIVANRITRVTGTDVHVNAVQGGSGEVSLKFGEIQEITITTHP